MQYELLKQYALLVQKRVLHKFHNNLPGFVGDLYYEPSFLFGPGGLYVDAVEFAVVVEWFVAVAQWSKGLVVFDDAVVAHWSSQGLIFSVTVVGGPFFQPISSQGIHVIFGFAQMRLQG